MKKISPKRLSAPSCDNTTTYDARRLLTSISFVFAVCALLTVAGGSVNHEPAVSGYQHLSPLMPPAAAATGDASVAGGKPAIRVRRQSFSMIQDLDALAEMLREASQRRRMQSALAFFNALRKRGDVGTATPVNDAGKNQLVADGIDVADVPSLSNGVGDNLLKSATAARENDGNAGDRN
jgi:hypothetical protein